jgi:3-oxoacyl-[acyl-carrier-protein] synthase II
MAAAVRTTSRSSTAEKFPVKFACEVKDFDPLKYVEKKEARKMGAFIQYAVAASQEAVTDCGLKITDDIAEQVGTYISSGIGDFWAIEREHSKLLKRRSRSCLAFLHTFRDRKSRIRASLNSS